MKTLKVLSKQLFGAKYERIARNLLSCLIIFFALYTAEIRIAVAPFILFLTATAFSLGVMLQALSSNQNADRIMGLFMLPFDNRRMTVSYVLAFGVYTAVTKTAFVLTILFAVERWSLVEILTALLCVCNGCLLAAVWYCLFEKRKTLLIVVWGALLVASVLFVHRLSLFYGIVLVSIITAICYLLSVNAYVFYRPAAAAKTVRHTGCSRSIIVYLLRYLTANKSYLVNSLGLWAISCFLPYILGQFRELNVMPLGFALLSLNTPICILLSCDSSLEQAVRALPGQGIRFCGGYCLFIACMNIATNGIYLLSWQLQHGNIGMWELIAALLFAFQSAMLSVFLEWVHPIRSWKTETDLWHHPRKYIVPLIMLLVAACIGVWPSVLWVWLGIMLCECIALLLISRRIVL